jgi:hypothetical protein
VKLETLSSCDYKRPRLPTEHKNYNIKPTVKVGQVDDFYNKLIMKSSYILSWILLAGVQSASLYGHNAVSESVDKQEIHAEIERVGIT